MSTPDFMADEAARVADLAAAAPAPQPKPAEPIFNTNFEFHHPHAPRESDITKLVNSDQIVEDQMRAMGRVAEADALKEARPGKVAQWRADLGLPAPVPPDAKTQALANIGRNPNAKPDDYRIDFTRQISQGVQEGSMNEAGNFLATVASANQLTVQTASWIMDAALAACAANKARTPDEKANAQADNLRLIEQRAGGYRAMKDRLQLAKTFLQRGGTMPSGTQAQFIEFLAADPLVNETIWNLEQSLKAHKKG